MAKGGGSAPSKTTTTTKMEPWAAAQGELKNVISEVANQYQRTGGATPEWIQKNFPDLTPEMQQSLSALASSGQINNIADQLAGQMGAGQANMAAASQGFQDQAAGKYNITGQQVNDLASELYDSDLVKNQKQQLGEDLQRQYIGNVHSLDQQATASGNIASSRAGVAQGTLAAGEQQALAQGSAAIENSARQAAQSQAMGILGQNVNTQTGAFGALGNLGSGQMQMGAQSAGLYQQALSNQFTAAGVGQQQAQQKAENDYYNSYGAQNAGWENLARYQNMMTQLGGMGGSQAGTATGGGGSKPNAMMGALGGAASGAAIGSAFGPIGTGVGAVAGGLMGAFSDATLKDRVKLVGKTSTGDNVYDWQWNGKAKKKGLKGKSSGVLAQDIVKTKPEAIGKRDGALTVDYDQTSVKTPKGQKKK